MKKKLPLLLSLVLLTSCSPYKSIVNPSIPFDELINSSKEIPNTDSIKSKIKEKALLTKGFKLYFQGTIEDLELLPSSTTLPYHLYDNPYTLQATETSSIDCTLEIKYTFDETTFIGDSTYTRITYKYNNFNYLYNSLVTDYNVDIVYIIEKTLVPDEYQIDSLYYTRNYTYSRQIPNLNKDEKLVQKQTRNQTTTNTISTLLLNILNTYNIDSSSTKKGITNKNDLLLETTNYIDISKFTSFPTNLSTTPIQRLNIDLLNGQIDYASIYIQNKVLGETYFDYNTQIIKAPSNSNKYKEKETFN